MTTNDTMNAETRAFVAGSKIERFMTEVVAFTKAQIDAELGFRMSTRLGRLEAFAKTNADKRWNGRVSHRARAFEDLMMDANDDLKDRAASLLYHAYALRAFGYDVDADPAVKAAKEVLGIND